MEFTIYFKIAVKEFHHDLLGLRLEEFRCAVAGVLQDIEIGAVLHAGIRRSAGRIPR